MYVIILLFILQKLLYYSIALFEKTFFTSTLFFKNITADSFMYNNAEVF